MGEQSKRYHFLLGGYDLEMVEIRQLLEVNQQKFTDMDLSWGARLSAYHDLFNDEEHFVGIELTEDVTLPLHYTSIDHHNENSHRASAIEQVAELLGIELTRYQLLVAANDSGYIPGMKASGASNSEIEEIRRKDRAAQGVTELDESLAEDQIEKYFHFKKDIGVVKTNLKKFSPIADRLQLEKLIIYNDKNLNYYGLQAQKLGQEVFKDQLANKTAYYGGGENGFFGINLEIPNNETIETIMKKILEEMAEPVPTSIHCFLFPFKWDQKNENLKSRSSTNNGGNNPYSKIDLALKKAGWERDNSYEINKSHLAYNEFTYYHDFVREVIFDTTGNENDLNIMQHYRFKALNCDDAYMKLAALPFTDKSYSLKLTGVHLHIYKTGVGILTFDLENYAESTREDILIINEYGRRMYPQFLGEGFDIQSTKSAFLASEIIYSFDGKTEIKEDFSAYNMENYISNLSNSSSFLPPKYIKHLLKNFIFTQADIANHDNNGIEIHHVTDDRMFTICWYGNNNLAAELGKENEGIFQFEQNDWWYTFIFGDKQWPSVANNKLKQKHIEDHTYSRWANFGTLFGLTRDTFMVISSDIPTLKRYNAPPIKDHVATIYYQMVLLGLAQRAAVLKFSGRVSCLADLTKENDLKYIQNKVGKLYKDYIEFVNKVYFREVTSQIQGIELYQHMQQVMSIQSEVADLDKEISELHSYISLMQDQDRNEQAHNLNRLAIFFLPASFIASVLGIGFIGEESSLNWSFCPIPTVGNSILLIFLGGGLTSLILLYFGRVHTYFKALFKKP